MMGRLMGDTVNSHSVDMPPPPGPSAGPVPPTRPPSPIRTRSNHRAALEARDRIIARLMD